jgi:hypothetical protein
LLYPPDKACWKFPHLVGWFSQRTKPSSSLGSSQCHRDHRGISSLRLPGLTLRILRGRRWSSSTSYSDLANGPCWFTGIAASWRGGHCTSVLSTRMRLIFLLGIIIELRVLLGKPGSSDLSDFGFEQQECGLWLNWLTCRVKPQFEIHL